MTSRVHDRIRLEECECSCLFRAVTAFVSVSPSILCLQVSEAVTKQVSK